MATRAKIFVDGVNFLKQTALEQYNSWELLHGDHADVKDLKVQTDDAGKTTIIVMYEEK